MQRAMQHQAMQHRRPRARGRAAFAAVLMASALACGHREERHVADAGTRRATASGAVVGFVGSYGSDVWLGIPYAAPPVGARRWRAPEPPPPWTDERQALRAGSPFVQYASPLGGMDEAKPGTPAGNEDCLYLNVYAPRGARAGQRLPVMMWIHGGGNTVGHAGFYDGGNLAATENVVVVAVNYRLGPFGWFRHAALRATAANEEERSGNFATLDLVRALEWVRDNAAAFGGDPGNVTIFGESAGGTNVYTLLVSPKSRGLFHRAIVESGGFRWSDPERAEAMADAGGDANSSSEAILRLLIRDRKASDHPGAATRLAAMRAEEAEAYLRGKSAADILGAYQSSPSNGMIDMPKVFADGAVIPAGDPRELFAAGSYNAVPVIAGTNHDENKLFMVSDPRRVRRLFWVVPRMRDERTYNLSAEYLSRMWKATGADEPAAAISRGRGSAYVYRFDWDEEPTMLGADLSVLLGAAHAFEIPFVFGHFDLGKQGNVVFTEKNQPGRVELSRRMMSYWAEFARHGAPGRGGAGDLVAWSSFDGTDPRFVVFDTPAGGGVRLESGALTREAVLASVETDSRLPTERDRCTIHRELAEWGGGFSRDQYAARRECAAFPYDGYPWG